MDALLAAPPPATLPAPPAPRRIPPSPRGLPRALLASVALHALVVGAGLRALAPAGPDPRDRTARLELRASAAEREDPEAPEEILVQEACEPEPLPTPPLEPPPPEEPVPEPEELLPAPPAAHAPEPSPFRVEVAHLRTRREAAASPPPRAVAPAGAAPPAPARPPTAARPALRPLHWPRISADTYPPEALRLGIEGTAIVEITVDPTGRVADARLHASSGSPILDRDALTRSREFRFAPLPEARRTRVPIRYRLT